MPSTEMRVESQRATGGHRLSPYPHLQGPCPCNSFQCLDLRMVVETWNVSPKHRPSLTLGTQGSPPCRAKAFLSHVVKLTYFFICSSSWQPGQKRAYLEEIRKDVTCGVPVPYLKDIWGGPADSWSRIKVQGLRSSLCSQVISSPAFCRCFKYVCSICLPGHLSGHWFPRIILHGSPLKTHLYRVLQYEF